MFCVCILSNYHFSIYNHLNKTKTSKGAAPAPTKKGQLRLRNKSSPYLRPSQSS